jgi:hypothetical protein
MHLPRYEHHSDGTPVYKPLIHDKMSQHSSLKPRHHDQRPPLPTSQSGMPPDYRKHKLKLHPIRKRHYGSAAESFRGCPDLILPSPKFSRDQPDGFSQKMPPYHRRHLPSHYVSQLNTDTPSLSTVTPTEDGTVTPIVRRSTYINQNQNYS